MLLVGTVVFSFLLNMIFTPLLIWFAKKKGWYDRLDERKIHNGNIPRLGGVGIFGSFLLAFLLTANKAPTYGGGVSSFGGQLLAAGVGSIVMFTTGLLDDLKNLRARYKLGLQIVAALIAVAGGLSFGPFLTPFGFTLNLQAFSILISIVWIVGVTNAVNLIDGMDGLAGGVTAIAAIFWILIALEMNQSGPVFLLLPAALLGAVLGFLVFNKPVAQIFMGDTGSLVLGYILSLFPLFRSEGVSSTRWLLVGITLLIIPIFDTLGAILRRIREKRSIGDPDRNHIHHKLLNLGWSVPKILALVYIFSIGSGLAAYLWIRYLKNLPSYYLPIAWLPTVLLFLVLHFNKEGTAA